MWKDGWGFGEVKHSGRSSLLCSPLCTYLRFSTPERGRHFWGLVDFGLGEDEDVRRMDFIDSIWCPCRNIRYNVVETDWIRLNCARQEMKIRNSYLLPSFPETDSIRLYNVCQEMKTRNSYLLPSLRRDGLTPSQWRISGNENPEFLFIAIISGDGFNPSLPFQHPTEPALLNVLIPKIVSPCNV